MRAFYPKYPYLKKYAKYRKYAPGGKEGVEEASLARGAGG